jgi:hypothetical protein
MAELNSAIEQIMAAIRKYTAPTVRHAPDYAPEDASAYPFVVCYPGTGTSTWEMYNARNDLHNLVIELHVQRKTLPTDIERVLQFCESIPAALKTAEKAGEMGAIDSFGTMTYVFGPMAWGSEDTNTLGFRWVLNEVLILHVS